MKINNRLHICFSKIQLRSVKRRAKLCPSNRRQNGLNSCNSWMRSRICCQFCKILPPRIIISRRARAQYILLMAHSDSNSNCLSQWTKTFSQNHQQSATSSSTNHRASSDSPACAKTSKPAPVAWAAAVCQISIIHHSQRTNSWLRKIWCQPCSSKH